MGYIVKEEDLQAGEVARRGPFVNSRADDGRAHVPEVHVRAGRPGGAGQLGRDFTGTHPSKGPFFRVLRGAA